MKATKPKIIAVLIGIVVVGIGALYLAKFMTGSSGKGSARDLLSSGIALLEKKQYKEARAKLEESYRKAPEGKLKNRAFLFLARSYHGAGEREKAIECWNKIIENPSAAKDRAEAFYSLGSLRSADGTPEAGKTAEDYYNKAVAAAADSRFASLAQVELAIIRMDRGDLVGAKELLDKVRAKKLEDPQLTRAVYRLNVKLLFSPVLTEVPESTYYSVKEGDTPEGMSKKFGTTSDLLQESNKIDDPRKIQIGRRIKVITGKFRLEVSKSRNVLQLLSGDTVLSEYAIGTGKLGSTPTGRFKITDKVKEPPWFHGGRSIPYGDPENVLGTRWMKLDSADGQKELTGYGIHGTDDASSIGKQSSEGCIRLLNRDVEELFKIVPLDTEVVIKE